MNHLNLTMISSVLAFCFLLGMMALVLFPQPGLAYCTHTDQFFLSDCGCEELPTDVCPHCQQEQTSKPCDDCSERIQLDIDDLIWSNLVFGPDLKICCPAEVIGVEWVIVSPGYDLSAGPIRPPPLPRGIPVFLLNSVFRI